LQTRSVQKNNRQRVLSEVLAVDAWHEPFEITRNSYGVFVELSFREARLGGDDSEFPFTFKAALRRALLTVKIEQPLTMDRASISRSIPAKQAEHTQILRARDEARAQVGANASIEPRLISAALSGSISTSSEVSKQDELRVVQTIPEVLVTARPGDRSSYSWELESLLKPSLRGQPWDPVDEPRMRVILPKSQILDPAISIMVTCALEDILITDLKPKDDGIIERVSHLIRSDLNVAAAIQHLKRLLVNADLEPGELDNRFNTIVLADILAMNQ